MIQQEVAETEPEQADLSQVDQDNSIIATVPPEILEMIFETLDVKDLLSARGVSMVWKSLSTFECRKRTIRVKKLIESREDFEAFYQIFENSSCEIPWSSFHRPSLYWNDFSHLLFRKFGAHLKQVNISDFDFHKCSIYEFFQNIPNVSSITFENFSRFDKIHVKGDPFKYLNLSKITSIGFMTDHCKFPIGSLSYMLLVKLCKYVKHVRLELTELIDGIAVERLANVLSRFKNVHIIRVSPDVGPYQKFIDAGVRISMLKFKLFSDLGEKALYEGVIANISTTLKRLDIFFSDKFDNQNLFQFASLPHLTNMNVLFGLQYFNQKPINCQVEPCLSDLTPSKVPVLKNIELYYVTDSNYDLSSAPLFKNNCQFTSVRFLSYFGFESSMIKLSFPNANMQMTIGQSPRLKWYDDFIIS